MKIEKLPSGSYRVRKMYKGINYSVVFDTKPSQKEALQALSKEMDAHPGSKKQRMTFKTAAQRYIDLKRNIYSPGTVREYTELIARLSPDFANSYISDITNMDIQNEINIMSKTKAPKTVKDYSSFIAAVIHTFHANLVIQVTRPKIEKNQAYIPVDEDVKKLLHYSKGSMFEVALILACFGLRRSEICALTLDDIEGNIIHINKALVMDINKKWVIKKPKTPAGNRDIWVPDEVIELIRSRGCIYSGFPGSISKYMRASQDHLNLPHFSLHKLRHYYASASHALGIPDSYIMQSGGWQSDTVLKSVYRHALDDKKIEMQKFSADYIKELLF